MTIAASTDQSRDGAVGDEQQERGRHQQLVGDRIEDAADGRLLLPGAGEIAVEEIGDVAAMKIASASQRPR